MMEFGVGGDTEEYKDEYSLIDADFFDNVIKENEYLIDINDNDQSISNDTTRSGTHKNLLKDNKMSLATPTLSKRSLPVVQ